MLFLARLIDERAAVQTRRTADAIGNVSTTAAPITSNKAE
jgi:hypothetical protein